MIAVPLRFWQMAIKITGRHVGDMAVRIKIMELTTAKAMTTAPAAENYFPRILSRLPLHTERFLNFCVLECNQFIISLAVRMILD